MALTIIRLGIPLLGSAIVSMAAFSCSSDDPPASGTGGKAGSGGSAGSSGKGGSSGSAGAKGDASTGDGGPDCYTKPARDPGGPGAEGSTCCTGFGSCKRKGTITDPIQAEAYGHDTCKAGMGADDLKCAPTETSLADAGALGVFNTCRALGTLNLEGRCLPMCFVAGNASSQNLVQGSCGPEMLCTPCYSPIDGTATGACAVKTGDQPVEAKPAQFAACGALEDGGVKPGLCVPEGLLTDPNQKQSLQNAFPADGGIASGCSGTDLCAPAGKVKDISSCFAKCTSVVGEGGCVPAYVVPTEQRSILNGMGCAAGELCAPCLNPLSSPPNQPTGACS